MKLKEMAKKGGIESIVGIMILVGLLIVLIVTIVLPMIKDSQDRATTTDEDMGQIDGYINDQVEETWKKIDYNPAK